jgi:hypothetical protein
MTAIVISSACHLVMASGADSLSMHRVTYVTKQYEQNLAIRIDSWASHTLEPRDYMVRQNQVAVQERIGALKLVTSWRTPCIAEMLLMCCVGDVAVFGEAVADVFS